jgi:SET family sugar efflux transporter-like MFS transporter
MGTVAVPSPTQTSALRLTAASPLHRGATIAMFLSGLGMSAAAPQIALFLVRDLGASLTVAGLFYLTNLTAPIAGYLVGSRSDRTGRRLGLFRWCAIAGFAGWAGISFSTELWMPFVVSALILGFAGAAGSQLFAALRDELDQHPSGSNEGVVAIVRMALTAGWVVGPVAGAWCAAQFGLRTMLFATAVCTLVQLVPLGAMRTPGPVGARVSTGDDGGAAGAGPPVPGPSRPALAVMLPLLAFTGLYVLVYAGESVKYAYLPIYMNEQLRLAPAVSGAVIGIQPLVELVIMPFSVMLGRRVGYLRLMAIGALFGVAANVCFSTTASAAGMFAGQILMGGVWGIFAALGIIVAQRLLPTAVATASAIFMSATAFSSALGGLTGGVGVAFLGLPHVFFIPGLFALLAALGLALMAKTAHFDR